MNIYTFTFQIVVFLVTMLIIYTAKPEKRYTRLVICTILIPVCLFILHMNCFFNTVPHCNGCLLVADGESKPPVDANDLNDAGMSIYLLLQIILSPIIITKNVPKGKRFLSAIIIILGTICIGLPLSAVRYM